jgi:hypothetical protein
MQRNAIQMQQREARRDMAFSFSWFSFDYLFYLLNFFFAFFFVWGDSVASFRTEKALDEEVGERGRAGSRTQRSSKREREEKR